jgi:hypothetical protein
MYSQESNLAISSSTVKNNNVSFVIQAFCYRVKKLKNSSNSPGLVSS